MEHSNPTVILGGGFTGLFTALHLSHNHYSHPVILIDQQERFVFKPLLYEFLSGEMSDDQVWPRYQELLQGSGVKFVQNTIQSIDLQQQRVELTSGGYTYNHLVLALGCINGYFGIDGAQEHSLPFRSGKDAEVLGQQLRQCLQKASQTTNPQERAALLTVGIIGAGSSGIELAATLADVLPDWYGDLDGNPQEIRIVLIERQTEILAAAGGAKDSLRQTAQSALQNRTASVELLLGAKVSAIRNNQVEFQRNDQSEYLQAATIVWTAGTETHPLIKNLSVPSEHRARQGHLHVTPTLQLPDYPEVFAGGDCAASPDNPLPPTAQVAYQEGRAIAHNLQALSEGKAPTPANIHLRGSLLKLGLGESAANLWDRFEVKGKVGHLIRQGTYLELLPTPVHNFKATSEWFIDHIFHHHSGSGSLVSSLIGEHS
ncbi:NADH dehydrogenase [uncultured Synechococcales cyanobacterium]|uniref:NADH dehydrogenase n=1 Tax=uncultured Synechococcales cyanobacterium TaxID=1936017 RepID=A0A6J4VME9_9CYAN|nr:NADH dehydrogenase [uncultured Synechococcales cyanobacterium]